MSVEAVLSSQVIDTTSIGRAVMTAADTAAARTAIDAQVTLGAGVAITTGAITADGQLTNALGTITASTPATLTQTWNAGAATFNGLLVNVTDTASASASTLMDLQLGGTSKIAITKTGRIDQAACAAGDTYGLALGSGILGGSDYSYIKLKTAWGDKNIKMWGGRVSFQFDTTVAGNISVDSSKFFGISSASAISIEGDTRLYRDAAGTFAQRNGTNAQTFRVYSTYTSATSYETLNLKGKAAANFEIGPESGSAGGTLRGLTIGGYAVGTATIVSWLSFTSAGVATFAGQVIESPPATVTLATNGQFSIEMTSDTAGNLVYRGSDGTTRRSALAFSA